MDDDKENYTHFIKECIRQLKKEHCCYVYSQEQINEVVKRFDGEVLVGKNECGYTLKTKRDRRNKNEFLEQKNKE